MAVRGRVTGHQDLPRGTFISGSGLGLASRASNKQGWIIVHDQNFPGRRGEQPFTEHFEGTYRVPDIAGEYQLVVLSSAKPSGPISHPVLLVAAYEAIVE